VAEIVEPEEACNDHDNPEVRVTAHLLESPVDEYVFEFVHPKHSERQEKYRYGLPRISEGARESLTRNKAMFKAAQALADDTDTPVEMIVYPTDELKDKVEVPDE